MGAADSKAPLGLNSAKAMKTNDLNALRIGMPDGLLGT
jgi:hypothetical protein